MAGDIAIGIAAFGSVAGAAGPAQDIMQNTGKSGGGVSTDCQIAVDASYM
jgi:hypothetical protein